MTSNLSAHRIDYLQHCRLEKSLAPHTQRSYSSDIADFLKWAPRAVVPNAVTEDTIRAYVRHMVDKRALRPTTVKRRLASLKLFFRWLESRGHVRSSVFHRLELFVRLPRRLPRALSSVEARSLLQCAEPTARQNPDHDALLLYFAVVALFTTGVRVSELTTARLPDVVRAEAALKVHGKGSRDRWVYMPGAQAVSVLRRFLQARRRINSPSDLLLVRKSGAAVTPQWIRGQLRVLASRANLQKHVTPHMLRHTAATELLEAGVDIRFVQRLLGHASIATTQIYAHVSDSALRHRLSEANTLQRVAGGRR